MESTHRLPDALVAPGEEEFDRTLRPQSLAEFVGQTQLKEQLSIFLEAAKARGEPCEHVLLRRAAGTRQDVAGRHHRRRDELDAAGRVRACHRPQGRHGGHPDRARLT